MPVTCYRQGWQGAELTLGEILKQLCTRTLGTAVTSETQGPPSLSAPVPLGKHWPVQAGVPGGCWSQRSREGGALELSRRFQAFTGLPCGAGKFFTTGWAEGMTGCLSFSRLNATLPAPKKPQEGGSPCLSLRGLSSILWGRGGISSLGCGACGLPPGVTLKDSWAVSYKAKHSYHVISNSLQVRSQKVRSHGHQRAQ